jgi:hypothetical protein
VVLTADALTRTTAASGLFTDHEALPELLDAGADADALADER